MPQFLLKPSQWPPESHSGFFLQTWALLPLGLLMAELGPTVPSPTLSIAFVPNSILRACGVAEGEPLGDRVFPGLPADHHPPA